VSAMHVEVVLAAGYGAFLLAAALGVDALARHTHRRSERYRTAGFRYREHLDAWECPEGQHLWPHEHDHERRLVRYRGKPLVCNACPSKHRCTDSDDGREIVRFLDPWIVSEAGRFHRAFSLMLVVLAALVAVMGLARHHSAAETIILSATLAAVVVVAHRLSAGWRFNCGSVVARSPR
jgi:hypothetical protein